MKESVAMVNIRCGCGTIMIRMPKRGEYYCPECKTKIVQLEIDLKDKKYSAEMK